MKHTYFDCFTIKYPTAKYIHARSLEKGYFYNYFSAAEEAQGLVGWCTYMVPEKVLKPWQNRTVLKYPFHSYSIILLSLISLSKYV